MNTDEVIEKLRNHILSGMMKSSDADENRRLITLDTEEVVVLLTHFKDVEELVSSLHKAHNSGPY